MQKTIIDLSNISKTFTIGSQNVTVLKEQSVSFKNGEFIIFFGPSGCGKSTLLHILLGLEPPTTGSVNFFNYNLYNLSEDDQAEFRKKYIGMIYQQPNWVKSLSVLDNIAFAGSIIGMDRNQAKQKALEMLDLVKMKEWANYRPTELSSGQQQKICFARALINDPQVIIADEPTGNLDFKSGIELMELFQDFNKQGKTIIMVTHNIDNIDYASSVVQMFDGSIVGIHTTNKTRNSDLKKHLLDTNTHHILSPAHSKQQLGIIHPIKKSLLVHEGSLKDKLKSIPHSFLYLYKNAGEIIRFLSLLFLYLAGSLVSKLNDFHFIPEKIKKYTGNFLANFYNKSIKSLSKEQEKTIKQVDLIDLSIKNMLAKKARSIITIGGMAIGIGSIVFLVSLGYGLEKLVISRVARLEEMRHIDAVPAIASNIKITDKSISAFKDIQGVVKILPIIGVAGRISYNQSNSDVAVYGVLSDYLKESAIKPSYGKIFTSNEISNKVRSQTIDSVETGEVAGASTDRSKEATYLNSIGEVQFKVYPNIFVRVRETPSPQGKLLGYTKRIEGAQDGTEVWGGTFIDDEKRGVAGTDASGKSLGLWIKTSVQLWEKSDCEVGKDDCETGGYKPLRDDKNMQKNGEGYIAEVNMQVEKSLFGEVLGIASDSAELATSSSEADILLELSSESQNSKESVKKISLAQKNDRQAVVNKSLLKVLGINENEGINKKISITLIATGSLLDNNDKIESNPVEYQIIGVTSDLKTPMIYIPLTDVKELGLNTYSQAKLVMDNQNNVPRARKQIEVKGFKTTSIIDTVSQIENLFGSARLILGILGVVALAVAALGMFNTLTISLLERTHEVGMMKAMGVKSNEVQELFLTESMIMGVFGGLGGLILGFLIGKVASVLLSVFAIFKGVGFLDVTYIPLEFIVLIAILSIIVGLATGIYPSQRATKISALDALRYE